MSGGEEAGPTSLPPALTPGDRKAVDAALDEIREEGPVDRAPLGCVLSLPAILVLLVTPVLDRRFGLTAAVSTPIIVTAVALLIVGITVWLSAGRFVRGHMATAAEAALRALETWSPRDDEREEALRAATLLVMNAHTIYGPTTTLAVDPDQARARIGDALPLVLAVERHLVEKGVAHPLLTEQPGGADAAG